MILLLLAAAAALPAEPCHPVLDGDRILGRHLAMADDRWNALPPDQPIGFAPVPGQHRVLSPAELMRLLPADAGGARIMEPLCLEWPMREPSPEVFAHAIQESLGAPEAKVEVLAFSAGRIPAGPLQFDRAGISSEEMITTAGANWRGSVLIDGKPRFSVWARVRIIYESERVVASEDLAVGQPIKAEQLRVATVRGLPGVEPQPAERFVGMTVMRPIRAGRPVELRDLRAALVIAKGDELEVAVQRGPVRFRTTVQAATAGRTGEWIEVKNPDSGKTFRALVDGPGKVHVP